MKIKKFIKRMLYVEYRLTVYNHGDVSPCNTYSTKRRLLKGKMKNAQMAVYWSLYKKGPFGMSEREVDCSLWHEQKEGGDDE